MTDPTVSLVERLNEAATMDTHPDPYMVAVDGDWYRLARVLLREAASRLADGTRGDRYEAALQSIANSACCGSCQEAALVAKKALSSPSSAPAATPAPELRTGLDDGPYLPGKGPRNKRVSAASRPAQTCATCKHADPQPELLKCFQDVKRPMDLTHDEFSCKLWEPAHPGPGAQEQE